MGILLSFQPHYHGVNSEMPHQTRWYVGIGGEDPRLELRIPQVLHLRIRTDNQGSGCFRMTSPSILG